ncbi:MAG: hypothetical protein SFV54_07570 [Bryobacteraceae bacterium]|nr:hypothetical protein [Bryobacteraceae bacterium]
MDGSSSPSRGTRRSFFQAAAGASGLAALARGAETASAPAPLPKVKFGETEVTRLIIGSNPFYGYTHFNNIYSGMLREYMTQDRRMEILHRAEAAGIGTWQLHYNRQTMEDFQRYRGEGGKMNWFLLGDFEMMSDLSLVAKVAKELKPIGIAHHGNRTDERFRAGEMNKVREFCKAVRDTGVMVGVSTHNPAVVDSIESGGWDIDYFMTCLYRVTRTREEAREAFGEAPMGEIYMEKDPERMTKMVRATKRPCLAFKILAAGRSTDRPKDVETAFRFAFENIKPSDAVIVGMCGRPANDVSVNADLARRFGAPASA